MLLVFFALILATSTVRAHGGQGYYQIRGERMGEYTVHVWTAPGLLRTGEVHVDTAIFDESGTPVFHPLIVVRFTAQDGDPPPKTAMAGSPYDYYPYTREARFMLDSPGEYRMEIMISDDTGMVGMTTRDLQVQTIPGSTKWLIFVLGLLSMACGVWLLIHVRSFWSAPGKRLTPDSVNYPGTDQDHYNKQNVSGSSIYRHAADPQFGVRQTALGPTVPIQTMPKQSLPKQSVPKQSVWNVDSNAGGSSEMTAKLAPASIGMRAQGFRSTVRNWYAQLNGPYHARALWIFMLIVVAHWLEHVLQIYQIYGLGWAPAAAGGLIGVFFPVLITSETLHFVYDFIQWAGIVVLRDGFWGRARKFWLVAMIAQTWHFIEHVLLMGQYLTGYYIAGRVKQTSILELYFPREELHFFYNLLVFIPMVIAVHYYLRPKAEIDPEA